MEQLEASIKEFHDMCDSIEKQLLPDNSSQLKSDIEFRKAIDVYDAYEQKLERLIPFEKRMEHIHDFFVTNGADIDKLIERM